MAGTPEIPGTPDPQAPFGQGDSNAIPRELAAGIACLLPVIGGIIMLVLERRDRYVRFYSVQSILLAACWIIGWFTVLISSWILQIIPFLGRPLASILWFLWSLIGLVFLVIWLVQLFKAFSGTKWEIPYLGEMANEFVETNDTSG
jgi:uncharacterized membrane protein